MIKNQILWENLSKRASILVDVTEIPEELDYADEEEYHDDFETDTDDVVVDEVKLFILCLRDAWKEWVNE